MVALVAPATVAIDTTQERESMTSGGKSEYFIAFTAGAILGAAIHQAAKERNMTLSQLIRSAVLGTLDLPEDVKAAAAQESQNLARRPGGGRRPRKRDTESG